MGRTVDKVLLGTGAHQDQLVMWDRKVSGDQVAHQGPMASREQMVVRDRMDNADREVRNVHKSN